MLSQLFFICGQLVGQRPVVLGVGAARSCSGDGAYGHDALFEAHHDLG